jgi:hypothetical protein
MRIQIFIRDDLAPILNDLAWRENRWPKQQAEWLLQQELERIALTSPAKPQQGEPPAQPQAVVCASTE